MEKQACMGRVQLRAEAMPTVSCSAKVRYETRAFHVCTCHDDIAKEGNYETPFLTEMDTSQEMAIRHLVTLC